MYFPSKTSSGLGKKKDSGVTNFLDLLYLNQLESNISFYSRINTKRTSSDDKKKLYISLRLRVKTFPCLHIKKQRLS